MGVAQNGNAQSVDFDSGQWTIEAASHQIVDYDGQPSLYLKGGEAVLNDVSFMNGTIEFDMAFSAKRGFSGVHWRRIDENNTEEFYFRPHQSGNPDANQYTPRNNGLASWQLYHGPQYAVPIRYRFNEWMHVKIAFSGDRGELYVDSDEPVLAFDLKRDPQAGVIAVWASGLAPAYFANFTYEENDNVRLVGTPEPQPEAAAGSVEEWSVSDPFGEDVLADMVELSKQVKDARTWQSHWSESSGVTNLADITAIGEGANTVFARLVIDADRDVVKTVRFGYSDRVRVYHNDRLIYSGDNGFRTRDYRSLGTIGLFDAVHLELERGRNEVWFAVSESFGGWGVMAAIEDMDGISVASNTQ